MAAIRFEAATVMRGRRTVLERVSFSIAPGAFIGVLGPNGAGKTTLLRAILGLAPFASGSIQVFGAPPRRGNPAIGAMPQSAAPPAGRLIGWEYVASAAQPGFGAPTASRAAQHAAERALELVDATSLARRPLAELSGGERQRLLLAQAVLGRPRLLLLDEPLISLDPRHQHGVVALVRRLQLELGLAVLFATHDLNPLLGVMDGVLALGGGQAVLGDVDAVVTGPVLSALYGTGVEVVRAAGRVFVLVGGADAAAQRHGDDDVRV